MAPIILKSYQREALKSVKKEFETGTFSQLIVLPTGSGKTYLMAAIAKEYNKPTLIIAHREELITQTAKKLIRYWPEADIGICKAELNELDHQIVIGSVQTCSQPKRLKQLKHIGFEVLMIDEAHHAPSKSYRKIINTLRFRNKKKLLVGVTATPERNDKLGLLDVFQKITFSRSISSMIAGGHLIPVFGRKILTTTSLVGVKVEHGDFASGSLAQAVNTPERNDFIATKFVTHATGRKAIAFCANVKHTQDLAESFNKHGIKAAAVWGAMPPDDRKKSLAQLQDGTLQVLTSCGVLTEGYDEETISCIVMARPTKSRGLYIQCVGRGLRKPQDPCNDKKDCLVLDFTDRYHKLDAIMTLRATIPGSTELVDGEVESLSVVDISATTAVNVKMVEVCDEEFNVLGSTRYVWIPLGDDEYALMDDDNQDIVIHPKDGGFIADMYDNDLLEPIVTLPTSLEECTRRCEIFAQKNLSMKFLNESWIKKKRQQRPTTGQIDLLKKNNVRHQGMSFVDALMEIRRIVSMQKKQYRLSKNAPATDKQKAFLEHMGIDAKDLSKVQAMHTISANVNNNSMNNQWKK